ncbi:MAG: peptidylprolyl isomerase [bacterium]
MKTFFLKKFSVLLGLVFLLAGCQHNDGEDRQPGSLDNRALLLDPDHEFWARTSPEVFQVHFETSTGDFVIEAHRDWAPVGVDRFYNLVRTGFFDNSRFYRVRAGFIAQFGIPGDPDITAVWKDRAMPDDPVKQSNTRGAVSYAMTGPHTRTTQLYINYGDNSRLDSQGFAPIGRVIKGMEIVDSFYAGYGEKAGGGMRGGQQGKMLTGGNAHLDKEFPKLERLLRAKIGKVGQ